MGLDNRDYVHDESGYDGFGGGGRQPGVAGMTMLLKATIAFAIIYVMAMLIPDLAANLTLSWDGLKSGKIWQFLTYTMTPLGVPADSPFREAVVRGANEGVLFFAISVYVTYQFGRMVEQFIGFKELAALCIACVLAGGIVSAFTPLASVGYANAGVIAGALLIWVAMERPHDQILFMFIIPMKMWVAAAIFLGLMAWSMTRVGPIGVLPFAASLALAAAHQRNRWRLSTVFDDVSAWKKKRSQPKLKVHVPEPEDDFDERVDAVLTKLGEEGESALSSKERKLLKQASKRYKDRV